MEGAVDLNIPAVLQIIDLLNIENKKEVLEQVRYAWRHLYDKKRKEQEKKRQEKEKQQKNKITGKRKR